jgi:cytochrome c-type biogenesis protein CcmE
MMSRHKRMWMVAGILAGVGLAAWLGTQAFRSNVMFFFDPTQIAAGEAPVDKRFRLGGMVEKGSVQKTAGTLDIHFLVTDFKHTVPVSYSGILPDLFREGQGVVAHGRIPHAQSHSRAHDEHPYHRPGLHASRLRPQRRGRREPLLRSEYVRAGAGVSVCAQSCGDRGGARGAGER